MMQGTAQFGTISGLLNSSGCAFVVRSASDGSTQVLAPYLGMPIYYGDYLVTGPSDRINVSGAGAIAALGASDEMSIQQHTPPPTSWIETEFGKFWGWVQDYINGTTPPQNPPPVTGPPTGPIGLNSESGTVPLNDGTTADVTSDGDWMGWDQDNEVEYDSYDDCYYDYGDDGGGGGGSGCERGCDF